MPLDYVNKPMKIGFHPYIPYTKDKTTKFKTLDGTNLKPKQFDTISKAKHFYSEYLQYLNIKSLV